MQTLFAKYSVQFALLPGAAPAWVATVGADDWLRIAQIVRDEGGRLVSLWGAERPAPQAGFAVSVLYSVAEGLLLLQTAADNGYPDLACLFPAASRMQRALFELLGVSANRAEDARPWLNHGLWPKDYFPLRRQNTGLEQFDHPHEEYPFVRVAGDGVHEIAVGPIHAGIIEPAHFRFSVVGEKVLRLEQRFGYTHKGVDKLFTRLHLSEGHRLAGRICGDSTVAIAWAYCMAAEAACACELAPRAAWLRALLLERERVANHLGDLGALGNDAGLALGLAQFSRLKEDWLRLNLRLFGHRLMMDRIVPGGVTVDLDRTGVDALMQQCDAIEAEVKAMQTIYEEHAGLQDRLINAGRVAPKLAAELGLCGLAGRASGQASDARADQRVAPYDSLNPRMATHRNGDVAARVLMRFEEIFESMRLLREIAGQMPPGPIASQLPQHGADSFGLGWVEGWRGAVLVALEVDARGQILRCHCHDPSWQNWPVLEHAIMGNIVPDFPLINKSFNLSYSGYDL